MENYLKSELYELIKKDDKIFDFLQDAALDGLWYWDLEKPEEEWMNPKFWEVLGYNPEEMPHKASAWQDIINQDDLKLAIDNFQKHVADPSHPYDQLVRYKHKSGKTIWIRCRGMAIRDKDGNAIRMLGAHNDVTKYYEAKEKLEESQSLAKIAHYSLDIKNDIWYNSDELDTILGIDNNYIKSVDSFLALVHPDDVKTFKDYLYNEVIFKGNQFDKEYRIVNKKTNETRWVHGRGDLKIDKETGKAYEMFGTIQDITDKKLTEIELQKSEERFRLAIEGSDDGLWDLDLVDSTAYMSERYETMLGYEPGELPRSRDGWEQLLHPEDLIKARESLSKYFESGKPIYEYYFRMKHKDGSYRWMRGRGKAVFDENGKPLRIVGFNTDIHDQKVYEEKLELQSKLLNSISQAVIATDLEGIIFYINKAATELYQWQEEEAIGKNILDVTVPQISHQHGEEIMQALAKGNEWQGEFTAQRKDGSKFLAHVVDTPIYSQDGELIGIIGISIDITEKKEIENKLKVQKDRLANIIEGTNVGTWEWNIQTNKTIFNEKWAEIIGYKLEELEPTSIETWTDLTHPYDIDKSNELIHKHINGELEYYNCEFRIKHKDGTWRWILDRGKVISYDKEGKPEWMFGTHQDITEKKEAELRVKENQEVLRLTLENLLIGVVVHDSDSGILNCNLEAERILGISEDQMKGKKAIDLSWNFIDEDLKPLPIDKYPVNIIMNNNEELIDYVIGISNKNTIHWVNVNGVPIFDNNNSIDKVIINFADITEQKEYEERIAKLAAAVEHSSASIMITDKDGKIEYVNPFFESITGYSAKEAIGKNPKLLKSGTHSPELYKKLWEVISNGDTWQGEFINKKKDGILYWESATISPIFNNKNDITHYVAVKQDITKDKETLLELEKAKRRAEESDKLKSAFLASMSHEIRTPLNSIVGFSNIIADEVDDPNLKTYSSLIRKQNDLLLKLINDIIDFAKIESEGVEIRKEVMNIDQFMKEMYQVESAKCKSNVALYLKIDNPYSNLIKTDKHRLNQIYTNLILNAIKFTDSGEITFGYKLDNDTFYGWVEDTGIGIEPGNEYIIFNRFIKLDTFKQGTGLGLSIIKNILDNLNGKIEVEKNRRVGARFNFEFPVEIVDNKEIDKEIKQEAPKNLSFKGKIFLIAEDDEVNFIYLKRLLEKYEVTIYRAHNGKVAIDAVKELKKIDLILMDIKMPGINGKEATSEIKQLKPEIPIIAQTAYALTEDRENIKKSDFDDYIAKPIVKDKLIEKILKFVKV